MKKLTTYQEKKYLQMVKSVINMFDSVVSEDIKKWKKLDILLPQNPVSKTKYRNFNQLFLFSVMLERNFDTPYFATFNQIKSKGGSVKGKGFPIVFTNMIYKFKGKVRTKNEINTHFLQQNTFKTFQDFIKNSGECRCYRNLKLFTVFHLSQTDIYDQFTSENYTPIVHKYENLDREINQVIERLKTEKELNLKIKQSDRAYYSLTDDSVTVPEIGQYEEKEVYYSILFHELSHWTGRTGRLDRDLGGSMGSEKYAMEEFVAELSSFFLCAHFGIGKIVERSTASYLKDWFGQLKTDVSVFNEVVSHSIRANDFILN